jgi:hypothetical protein
MGSLRDLNIGVRILDRRNILIFERTQRCHAVREMDCVHFKGGQGVDFSQYFFGRAQSRAAGAANQAYQDKGIRLLITIEEPFFFPHISETDHGRAIQIPRAIRAR